MYMTLNTQSKGDRQICGRNRLWSFYGRVQLKFDGTRWRAGGEVKGKLANGVGSQYSHTTSEHGLSSITTADAHTWAASSRLNWRPRLFKWTRLFRRKTKSGFCAGAITFQTHSTIPTYILEDWRMLETAGFAQNWSWDFPNTNKEQLSINRVIQRAWMGELKLITRLSQYRNDRE